MKKVDALMQQAVSDSVFPGGVLLVFKDDSVLFHEAYGYTNIFSGNKISCATIFDLASLTKPLATTIAVMRLVELQLLDLEQDIGSIIYPFKNTDKAGITILNLLVHNSGLPDYRPFYKDLFKLSPENRKDQLKTLLIKEPLINPVGKSVLYSDLGFMILCWLVEEIIKTGLDEFLSTEVYKPMGIVSASDFLFYAGLNPVPCKGDFAVTEFCRWRNAFSCGVVHDENAYAAGGVAGHSGLFGTAFAVKNLLVFLLRAYNNYQPVNFFGKNLLKRFFSRYKDTGRALGFDTPSVSRSSSGKFFSYETVGHLGFTGTSFWMDFEKSIIVILLTNRVHPSRNNNKIKVFRPYLHDIIMTHLL